MANLDMETDNMKRRFPTFWTALLIILALGAWLTTGDIQRPQQEPPAGDQASAAELPKVAYREIRAERIIRQLPVQGQLEPARVVKLQARIRGTVEELPVAKGQRVSAGQVIVRLSEEDRPARKRKAEAELALALSELQAAQALTKRGLAAETDVKSKEAAVARARADLATLEQELKDTEVVAPFDAVLESLPVELGQMVQSGTELALLVDDNRLKMSGQVPQQMVGRLTPGQRVNAYLLDGTRLEGELVYIAHQADVATRGFAIEATLENPEHLRLAGATASLAVELGEVLAHGISPALLSLDAQGRLSVEHLSEDNLVLRTPVERVHTTNTQIWVSGLPERVRLVTLGRGFVQPGAQVQAVEESTLWGSTRLNKEAAMQGDATEQEGRPHG